jgi:RND family efflux transporter MFP subunit
VKKKRKKTVIILAGILVTGAVAVVYAMGGKTEPFVNVDLVKRGRLVSAVNASGMIQSVNEQFVYSSANLPAKEVLVKPGDHVTTGQTLAVLDPQDLETTKAKLELSLASSQEAIGEESKGIQASIANAQNQAKTAELQVSRAKLAYDKAKQEHDEGTNPELEKALYSYNQAKDSYENETGADITRAKADIATAEKALADRKKELDTQTSLHEGGVSSLSQLEQAQSAYDAAIAQKESADAAYKALRLSLKATMDQTELDIARIKDSLSSSFKQADMDLKTAKASLDGALTQVSQAQAKGTAVSELNKESQAVELESVQEKLSSTELVSPISGTVTKVDLKVGQVPSGVVFVIEDMNNLQVKLNFKEYDLKSVGVGLPARVKTDATGDKEYEGTISYIAPTSRKDAGSTTNVEFESLVSIDQPDDGLRIGMNARVSVILGEKDETFYVPYDYIGTTADGSSAIYVLDNGIVKEILVQTGIESDLYTEITGEGLEEGLMVLTDPSSAIPGQAATPSLSS